jgi:hypothetical protein
VTELTTEQRERIEDFVAALRSGEYAQTTQQLGKVNDDDGVKGYCCEGVAVERYAAQLDGWSSDWLDGQLTLVDADGNEDVDYAEDSFWEQMALTTGSGNDALSVFAFITPEGQDVRDTGAAAVSFMRLNDDGFTFPQIADLIEWQFLRDHGK